MKQVGKALAPWRSRLSRWGRGQAQNLRWSRGQLQRLAAALPGGARPWISLISLGFVLAVLMTNGRELLQLQLDGQGALWLALATGLTLASLTVNGLALGGLLAWLGHAPRWDAIVSLFVATNLRKYLPGGIWHLTARVEALHSPEAPLSAPLSQGAALLVSLLEPLLAATAALLLVAAGGWQNGLGLLALVPLALLAPPQLRRLLPALERRRARELALESEPGREVEPSLALPGYPWPPLLLELLFVLLRFAGFACCVWAFDLQGIIPWTTWLAGFALAWTAGLVVPGAPGGLGVFETVLLLRLRVVLPDAQLLAVALSYRLGSTLADVLGAGLVEADQWLTGRTMAPGAAAAREPDGRLEQPPAKSQAWPALLRRWLTTAWPLRRSQRGTEDDDA